MEITIFVIALFIIASFVLSLTTSESPQSAFNDEFSADEVEKYTALIEEDNTNP